MEGVHVVLVVNIQKFSAILSSGKEVFKWLMETETMGGDGKAGSASDGDIPILTLACTSGPACLHHLHSQLFRLRPSSIFR